MIDEPLSGGTSRSSLSSPGYGNAAGPNGPSAPAVPGGRDGLPTDPTIPSAGADRPTDSSIRSPAPDLPAVSLPTGGGAIRGIGEKFDVNAVTGTASLTIPLPLSPGRSGFTPPLSLSYDSGEGNGPYGFGWALTLSAITRKTDKGLPCYHDHDESDVFILAEGEDLVPVRDDDGVLARSQRRLHGCDYEITRYRPRIEGSFARIERWCDLASGISHWRTISRDNVTTLYGTDPLSRIADPDDPRRAFSYLIAASWTDKGNACVYEYIGEDDRGIDRTAPHEFHRSKAARETQRYLKAVRYGNAEPYYPDWSENGHPAKLPTRWHFSLVIDYGDHSSDAPEPEPDQAWAARPDPFSTYRSRFEVRTYRRACRALMFHDFPNEPTAGTNTLVRSLTFEYRDEREPAGVGPIYTELAAVTQTGHRRQPTGYLSRSFPPLELEYAQPEIHHEVLELDRDSLANLPAGITGSYRLIDLDGEGLSGVLIESGDTTAYKRNLSPANLVRADDGQLSARARLGPLNDVAMLPGGAPLGRRRLLDLDGSGHLDVVQLSGPAPGFYKRTPTAEWEPFRLFQSLPNLNWDDPNIRLVDLTGDGLADAVSSESEASWVYPSLGTAGFAPPQRCVPPLEHRGHPPAALQANAQQAIFFADMSGDGLSDLVRVRHAEVCYWPNTGYGTFGEKVVMDRSPGLSEREEFDAGRVRLADIDGTGTSDLVYVGRDGVRAWFNESGNAWSPPVRFHVPTTDNISDVQVADLLGTGTACLVWSSPLPGESSSPLRYVDLLGGRKPHLLTRIRNNLGAETRLTWAPSTRFYVADAEAGRPWVTRLPFVVHVLERSESIDWIGRSLFATRFAYHHGYFDPVEREFRGFGMVEQWDTEEHREDTAFPDTKVRNWDQTSWTPPRLTRIWFHTGAVPSSDDVSRQHAHEYWVEPALRAQGLAGQRDATLLADSVLPEDLTADETREAYRSLKGAMLRSEVFGLDGSDRAENPYTVSDHNFTVNLVQKRGPNRHAVFFPHPRETLSSHYERAPDDARVTHELTLEVDEFGNVLRRMSLGYPRRPGHLDPEPELSELYRQMLEYDQGRLHLVGTENRFTNGLTDPLRFLDVHRTPLPAEQITAELTGLAPAAGSRGEARFFFEDLERAWREVWDGRHDLPNEEIETADVDGRGRPARPPARRIIEHTRTVYRRDDLAALLPLGRLESLATFGQSYRLALTPGLLTRVFGTGVDSGLLNDAGYVQIEEGHEWWIPFARAFFSGGDRDRPEAEVANARAHFYVHRRVIDAFGAIHRVDYDPYDLLPIRTTDPVGNITSGANDYRVLEPVEVTDPNGNRAQASLDALGLIAGTAVMGKPTEHVGDSLGDFDPDPDPSTVLAHLREPLQNPAEILGCASTRFVYDMFAFYRTRADAQPRPPVTYTLARETHVSDLDPEQESRYRHVFIYGDGLGREVQRKVQAPRDPSTGGPRWIGSGWTIFNNKGDPVRTYEPFFTSTHEFEFAVAVGVSTNLFYDPARRVVATLHPNGTWAKVVLNNWRQESWDVNDTVLIADPRTDPDVGDHFRRLLGDEGAFVSWYEKRIGGHYGATAGQRTAERNAAQKAATHARTPIVSHFDVLGRACLTVLDNGADGRYPSRVALDAENKPLAVFDTMGRRACEYCVREETDVGGVRYIAGHDMAGNLLYHVRMDSGARRTLASVSGDQVRAWDARGQVFDVRYDLARRPTHRYVSPNGRAPVLLERLVYGEGLHGQNLCGRLFRRYDGAGVATNERYDFKGNLLQSRRQFAQRYDETVDWNALSDVTREADLDAAASPLLNPADSFLTTTTFDALNRVIQSVTPHSATMRPNILRHSYNEAGLLQRLDVWTQRHSDSRKQLELGTADLHPIRDITYNARGQRTTLLLGNGTFTTFRYDAQTFQLTQLQTLRRSGFERDQRVVQNLAYTYDPAGNITRISDDADLHNVIFFRNRRVEPSADYTYDPIYRLIRASGREHVGQARSSLRAPQQVTNDDGSRIALPHPADGHAMGRYTERYNYDSVGNVLAMMHQATGGSWRRHYRYAETSQITGAETCNRLTATSLPGSPPAGPYSATYSHDAHGNMTRMPHLPELAWDEHDRLRSTAGQVVNVGTPETTFYAYDADGQRLRKATDRQATRPRQAPTRRRERLYLGGVEIYREYGSDGLRVTLTRETLHVVDGTQRVALIETRTALHGSDPAPPQLVRYQYSNHLGSAVLELDHQAQVISYEEYYPYGSTAYEAGRSQTETPKRYRYTGKERDEESGLYYYGARYYAPWLARWTSCDPVVFSGAAAEQFRGDQHYVYVENRPTVANDPDGRIIWFVVIAAVVITALTVESAANAPANAQQAARAEPAVSDAEFAAHAAVNAATLAAGGAASGRVLTGTGSRVLAGAAGGGVAGVTGAPLNRAVSDVARGQVSSPGQYVTDAVTGAAVGAGIGAAGGAVSRVVRGPVPSRSGSPPAPSEASNQGGTGAGTRGAVDAAKPMVTAPDTGATPPTPSVGGATPDPGDVPSGSGAAGTRGTAASPPPSVADPPTPGPQAPSPGSATASQGTSGGGSESPQAPSRYFRVGEGVRRAVAARELGQADVEAIDTTTRRPLGRIPLGQLLSTKGSIARDPRFLDVLRGVGGGNPPGQPPPPPIEVTELPPGVGPGPQLTPVPQVRLLRWR